MAVSSVVSKYAACTQFDSATGECTTVVWVDPPAVIPPLSASQGAMLGGITLVVWTCVYAAVLLRSGARIS